MQAFAAHITRSMVCVSLHIWVRCAENGWTDRKPLWELSHGPKELCVRWGSWCPYGKGQSWGRMCQSILMYIWMSALHIDARPAPASDKCIHCCDGWQDMVNWWCGPMPNYFGHLLDIDIQPICFLYGGYLKLAWFLTTTPVGKLQSQLGFKLQFEHIWFEIWLGICTVWLETNWNHSHRSTFAFDVVSCWNCVVLIYWFS